MHTMTLFDRPEGCKNVHRNAVVDELGKLMSLKLWIMGMRIMGMRPLFLTFVCSNINFSLGNLEHRFKIFIGPIPIYPHLPGSNGV